MSVYNAVAYCTAELLISSCSLADQRALVNDLDIIALSALHRRDHRGHELSCAVIGHRLRSLLRDITDDPDRLLDEMRTQHTILSGSACLVFLTQNKTFIPADYDFYCAFQTFPQFYTFIATILHGKLIHRTTLHPDLDDPLEMDTDPRELQQTGLHERCIFLVGNVQVDVMRSATASPVTPLGHCDNTLLVNYVTADVVCAAYPRSLDDAAAVTASSENTDDHIQLYKNRGYTVFRTPIEYRSETPPGLCALHGYCP